MPPLTLGTAGHIDHGKTALVKALTGVDTDRLAEERRRGMTIELGYAPLRLPSGRRLSVVDVPGHERLVRTMVAGATGIDLFLMAVAADDGVMPQTREHAAVLHALDVRAGVVAVTKTDVAEVSAALLESVAELLPGAPVVAVSARTGEGLRELGKVLDATAGALAPRRPQGPARLHVDRVFTVHGAGTVVTGTLWSGSLGSGDDVLLLPRGRRARVRAVQVHDEPVERAPAGQRVAVNLAGVRRDDVSRGDVVATGDVRPTFRLEAAIAAELPARVIVHHGTRETLARPVAVAEGIWQLRLDAPLIALTGDRVVVRAVAPADTLGGGVVVDASPPRRRTLDDGSSEPADAAVPPPAPIPAPPAPLGESALEAEARLRAAGLVPPSDADLGASAGDLASLREHGRAVRIGPGLHIHAEALAEAEQRLLAAIEAEGSITLGGFRDELATTRRCAQALLEHFDAERITLRRGEARVLRRRPRQG